MPTSNQGSKKSKGNELFYIGEDGKPTDEGLHDEMLDTHPGPHATSVIQLRELGFKDDEIKKFLAVDDLEKILQEDTGD
jgi:hypothetical protein